MTYTHAKVTQFKSYNETDGRQTETITLPPLAVAVGNIGL